MNNVPSLSTAKSMLKQNQFQQAIAILETITNQKSEDSAEAAYCLGIIHESGSGVPKDINEAAKYYLMAEQRRYPMATYRLGRIYHDLGEQQKAYDSFRSVAQSNPSAAYWAYGLLMSNRELDSDPDASEKHLNSAAAQGHVRAQRIIAMRYISGRQGLLKIPYGLRLFANVVRNTFQVTNKGEKMKYQ